MTRTRQGLIALATVVALAGPAAGAAADSGLLPYDGSNPFNCTLQELGTGTAFPDPHADPLCVEYDKTNQSLAQLGILQFAAQEPARTAVAFDKCFYFQHDHWTGSVSQGQSPELWHWDGSYYYDKGRGTGAMYFENLRVGGYGDWAPILPLLPPDIRAYAHPTGWGAVLYLNMGVDPACAARVATPEGAARVYRQPPGAPVRPPLGVADCTGRRARVHGRALGPLALGMTRRRVLRAMGTAPAHSSGALRFCLAGGGEVVAVLRHGRAALLLATGGQYAAGSVRPGSHAAGLRRRVRSARYLLGLGRTRVYEAGSARAWRLLVGVRRGRVAFVAVADPALLRTREQARRWLRRAGV